MNVPSLTPCQLSVSLVVHNSSLELLQRTLESLVKASREALSVGLGGVRVQIVDNASEQGYREEAQKIVDEWPSDGDFLLKFIQLDDNLGFGAGHNAVLAGLQSDFHLVLNPDVELQPDALARGLARMEEDPSIVLLSPRVNGETGEQEFLCKRYPSVLVLFLRAFAPRFIRRLFAKRLSRYQMEEECSGDQAIDVLHASGCCMLIRRADLQAVGGFDDDYFLYFEDFDLSLRLGSRGRLVFDPAMRIVHHGGYAASKGYGHMKFFVRSVLLFFRQHGWRWI